MLGNPLAADIHRVFEKDIFNTRSEIYAYGGEKSTEEKIMHFKRTTRFVDSINRFFIKCGQKPFLMNGTEANEKNLLNFALQLSGYIRDAQGALDKLSDTYARDEDIIQLYRAAANYTVACNGKIAGSKYYFEHNKDYCFWKIDNPQDIANSNFSEVHGQLPTDTKMLILSMPFHIKPQNDELRKWTYEYMHDIFQAPTWKQNVEIYIAHFPIEQPRGEKFALALKTMKHGNEYFEPVDMQFVALHLKDFIGRNLQIDTNGTVISGEPYSLDELSANLRRINCFGYCAGAAHAHRWINAINHIGKQIYPPKELEQAMPNIFMASYAFLPSHQHNLYSGAHFMSNHVDDTMRKEPFIKMFNPETYEAVKCNQEDNGTRITVMPDKRNFVIASELPPDLLVIDQKNSLKRISNQENGHHIAFITTPNINSADNFPQRMFANVLRNAVDGYRGEDVFTARNLTSPNDILRNAAIVGRQNYR